MNKKRTPFAWGVDLSHNSDSTNWTEYVLQSLGVEGDLVEVRNLGTGEHLEVDLGEGFL